MNYIDPLRPGERNDRMQALQNKYTNICTQEGLAARTACLAALRNLDLKGQPVGTQAIAWVVARNSHSVAASLLDSPEFRPLARHWVERFPREKQDMARVKLEDIGALAYQRAVRSGE
jgi:hypothetical protein